MPRHGSTLDTSGWGLAGVGWGGGGSCLHLLPLGLPGSIVGAIFDAQTCLGLSQAGSHALFAMVGSNGTSAYLLVPPRKPACVASLEHLLYPLGGAGY